MEICSGEREIGLNFKDSRDRWDFIATEQGVGGQWMGNYYEETSGLRFWLDSG